MKQLLAICATLTFAALIAHAQVIVNDSWADGGRTDGADPQDTPWWTSTGSTAIEVSSGNLGLVLGGSGRGIHGTFGLQSLGIGDTLQATITFSTPVTVTNNKSSAFRIGLFDTTGKESSLAADLSASTSSPNALYNGLPGYMVDLDVNLTGGGNNQSFREHNLSLTTGQLMAQTGDYISLSAGGSDYSISPNTTYKYIFALTRTGTDSLDLTGTLYQGLTQLSTYTTTDASGIVSSIGMIAFHGTSLTFGSSNAPNTLDNGIDFSNIKIEYTAVPEPSVIALFALVAGGLLIRRKTKA